MKKTFLFIAAFVMTLTGAKAQDDLVATLSHNSTLSTFTGADALSEAYTVAVEGDVITLSPGVFNAVTIEKAITIRGAGMMDLESNGNVSTQLAGDMTINVPSDASTILTLEGVQALGNVYLYGSNLAPVKLLKSRFQGSVTGWGVSLKAYSCIFANQLNALRQKWNGSSQYVNTTLNCMNCVVVLASSQGYNGGMVAKIVATNCLLSLYYDQISYSSFTNCIITSFDFNANYPLPQTCSAQNCLGINSNNTPNLFANISNPSNVMADGSRTAAFTPIFKTLTMLGNNPAFTETFELTSTAAATYLGDDGTQVGIYGGPNPFNPTPTNPQVKKFTVNSTTEGNQLKVKINVE